MKKIVLLFFIIVSSSLFCANNKIQEVDKTKLQKTWQKDLYQAMNQVPVKSKEYGGKAKVILQNIYNSKAFQVAKLPLGFALVWNARRKFYSNFIIPTVNDGHFFITNKALNGLDKLYTLAEFTAGSILLLPHATAFSNKTLELFEKWLLNKK